jgi:hypothetical protein
LGGKASCLLKGTVIFPFALIGLCGFIWFSIILFNSPDKITLPGIDGRIWAIAIIIAMAGTSFITVGAIYELVRGSIRQSRLERDGILLEGRIKSFVSERMISGVVTASGYGTESEYTYSVAFRTPDGRELEKDIKLRNPPPDEIPLLVGQQAAILYVDDNLYEVL